MTHQQFLDKYLGKIKGYPDDKHYLGECLSIVKLYIKEVFEINPPPSGTNSAYGYWSNFPDPLGTVFEKVKNTPDLIPEEGWLAVWKPWTGNPYGHIAIVAKGCTKSTLKNNAQNWTSKVFQLESNKYTNVVGFLKPIKMEVDPILKFIKDNNITEGQLREGYAYVKDQTVPKLQKKVEELAKNQIELDKKIIELEAKYTQKQELEVEYQSTIKTANTKLVKMTQKFNDMEIEKKKWQSMYNDKNTEFNKLKEAVKEKANDMIKEKTFWEVIELLIKKIKWNK